MVQYIDMTPTWRGVLPLLMAAVESGTFEGAKIAREELGRMADLADARNAAAKATRPTTGNRAEWKERAAHVAYLAECVAALQAAHADDLAEAMLDASPDTAAKAEQLRAAAHG